MNKKKALLIGEYSVVEWHPLAGTDKELQEILSDFEVECTEDYERFQYKSLSRFDLCISFVDHWKQSLSDEQTAGLLAFTANGGGLLAIHNGIALQNRFELAQLIGAKFTTHPEERILNFRSVAAGHPIVEGIRDFSFMEEPYQFIMDSLADSALLMEYESEGKRWPAAWAHKYGMGRVVYLSPGHHSEAFQDPMFRRLIQRSALWAVRAL